MMSSKELCAVALLALALTFSAAQTSCKGRCGVEYYRGYMCQCDYSCLSYGECCNDYESQCTTKYSCKGRCGELFTRGRRCSCDADCVKFKQCCSDYTAHCDAEETSGAASETAPVKDASCDNVNNSKHKELTVPEEITPITYETNADDYLNPVDDPTSYPPDDFSDDEYNQTPSTEASSISRVEDLEVIPTLGSSSGNEPSTANPLDQDPTEPTLDTEAVEFTTEATFTQTFSKVEDLEGTLIPDSSSGNETSTADLLDQVPTKPTLDTEAVEFTTEATFTQTFSKVEDLEGTLIPDSSSRNETSTADPLDQDPTEPTLDTEAVEFTTEATFNQTEPTPSDDNKGNATFAITDAGDFKPPAEEGVNPFLPTVITDPSTSVPQTKPTLSTSEIVTDVPPSGEPEITINTTQDSDTVQEFFQSTTIPASTTLASTANPEQATSRPSVENVSSITTDRPSLLADPEDPTIPVPASESGDTSQLDAVSTPIPTVQDDITGSVKPEVLTVDPLQLPVEMTSPPTTKPSSKPQDKPKPHNPPPPSKPETKPLDTQTLTTDNTRDYQADDSNDTNLCSGRPVSAVTTLRNGTMVVFRGHYFWFLDRNREPSPPQGITQVWGVPSPVDTVFTRCNCQGKTYIFKGGRYWRFENDVLDPGYPKVIKTGFDGLQGHVTAALSVPQYRNKGESVYFFKRGGFVQKYSYQVGTSPTCGKKFNIPIYTVQVRRVRQAVSVLEPAIKIQRSWRGFPSTITAAVSVPSSREPEGYKYFVFSRSTSYNVRMNGERPVIAAPKANSSPQANNFFRCPQKS